MCADETSVSLYPPQHHTWINLHANTYVRFTQHLVCIFSLCTSSLPQSFNTSYVLGLCLGIQTSNWTCTWTWRQFSLLPQILSNSKCAPQIVALPLVSFSTSVLQRCKQPSRTDSSSSVMCLGAGCIGRSGGIRDCVNGLCITDLCTGDVLGTSEDEGPCCSTVLHSLTRWNTKI